MKFSCGWYHEYFRLNLPRQSAWSAAVPGVVSIGAVLGLDDQLAVGVGGAVLARVGYVDVLHGDGDGRGVAGVAVVRGASVGAGVSGTGVVHYQGVAVTEHL